MGASWSEDGLDQKHIFNNVEVINNSGIGFSLLTGDYEINGSLATGNDTQISMNDINSRLQIDHSTIIANTDADENGIGFFGGGEIAITNSILFNNISFATDDDLDESDSFFNCGIDCSTSLSIDLSYNIVYPPPLEIFTFDENIDSDPLLNEDYTLSFSSPAINMGDPNAELDLDGSTTDMGAFPIDFRVFRQQYEDMVTSMDPEYPYLPIQFNEVMIDADGSAIFGDPSKQYIELKAINLDYPLWLDGFVLSTATNSNVVFDANSYISPGSYYLIGRNSSTDDNGGIEPDFVYESNWDPILSTDQLTLVDHVDRTLDNLIINEENNFSNNYVQGRSIEFAYYRLDYENDSGYGWAQSNYEYSPGLFGTPGMVNQTEESIPFCNPGNHTDDDILPLEEITPENVDEIAWGMHFYYDLDTDSSAIVTLDASGSTGDLGSNESEESSCTYCIDDDIVSWEWKIIDVWDFLRIMNTVESGEYVLHEVFDFEYDHFGEILELDLSIPEEMTIDDVPDDINAMIIENAEGGDGFTLEYLLEMPWFDLNWVILTVTDSNGLSAFGLTAIQISPKKEAIVINEVFANI